MGSRREEERNEKIIRGLMKLPPNRRCINCNSLGPQYVCTNFWTFVCMACSGIHREFTHRVKSVSMAKFTSQEVEALQNGGNQRAREIYLKNWDPQRQRLPDSSNADKVREFIKSVYVEKKYAGGKTSDKPPRDSQTHTSSEDVMRRASSYHSYSQSPPYDYQYEERRYRKQAPGFNSRSGSEQGLYGKASSFVYSPGRFSDHMYEDRFAKDGSGSRASDFSVSGGGDPFRSATQSPNFQEETGYSSLPFQNSKLSSSENLQQQITNLFPDRQPQRTTSVGSARSFDSNSSSIRSCNSGSFVDAALESEQTAETLQDKTSTRLPSSTYGRLDLFNTPIPSATTDSTKATSIDLFLLPEAPMAASISMFQSSTSTQAPTMNSYQPPQTYPSPSVDFFAGIADQQPSTKPTELSVPKDEGWATFDSPQSVAPPVAEVIASSGMPQDESSSINFQEVSQFNSNTVWPMSQNSSVDHPALSIPGLWHEGFSAVSAPNVVPSTSSWNAFYDFSKDVPLKDGKQFNEPPVAATNPSLTADQQLGSEVLEDPSNDGMQRATKHDGHSDFVFLTNIVTTPTHAQSVVPVMEEACPCACKHKSSNPFDFPYDSELEPHDMFVDMSSLQGALPNVEPPSTSLSGVSQPWFSQDPVAPFMPAPPGAQGGLAYLAGQAPTSQLQNVPAQEPVASIRRNPFA